MFSTERYSRPRFNLFVLIKLTKSLASALKDFVSLKQKVFLAKSGLAHKMQCFWLRLLGADAKSLDQLFQIHVFNSTKIGHLASNDEVFYTVGVLAND